MVKKIVVVLLFVLILLLLTGCKPQSKTIKSVEFESGESTFTFDLDAFRLSDIKLDVKYSDGTNDIIPVKIDMLSDDDFEYFLLTGTSLVYINYGGKSLEATIIINSDNPQPLLPGVAVYNIKNVSDGKTSFTFYTTGKGNYISYQLKLGYDSSINNVIVTEGEDIEGSFVGKAENGELTVIHTMGSQISGFNELFTVTMESTEISDLILDKNFSVFYDLATYIVEVRDIRYYNR